MKSRRTRPLLWLAAIALVLAGCGVDAGDDEEAASFVVSGDTATMAGLIGPSTPDAVRDLLEDHPEVTTISMLDVPGSEDDQSNLEASRLVRAAGLATHVPSDGFIASGGVDFFLAGTERSWESGAEFGVHSWAAGDQSGADVPPDDAGHDLYLDYYDEMGVDEAFYWFTLESAPPESFHVMTEDELAEYGFATG